MSEDNGTGAQPVREFAARYVAGSIAGGIEACATVPLETLKTRQQLSTSRATISASAAATEIYSSAGIRGFYFGLPALLLQAAGKVAIRFSSFGLYRGLLVVDNSSPSSARLFLAGAAAGVTEAALWITPCERMKTLRVAEIGLPAHAQTHRSLASSLSHLARTGGLFRGLSATAIRNGSAVGVRFTVYPKARAAVDRFDSQNRLPRSLVAGFSVGALTTFLTQPVDVVKSRMQGSHTATSVSLLSTLKGLISAPEGPLSSLSRGLGARVLKIGSGQAIIFATYESVQGFVARGFGVGTA